MKPTIKILFFATAAIVSLVSCNKNEEMLIGDEGYHLSYRHVPTETLLVFENDYSTNLPAPDCADLHVWVMSSLKDVPGYSTPQHYLLNGEKEIEQQISTFLDPHGNKYTGMVPIPVSYTTEECKTIKISLMDKENNFLEDITDEAQFFFAHDLNDVSEVGCNIVINAKRKLLGKIENGKTIQDYLVLCPMVFAEAHFVFPKLKKDIFANGTHAVLEIELGNGSKLATTSINNAGG